MKITDVTPQKNNKHRVSVFVDNEYAFSLDETDAVFMKIKIGREITKSEIDRCLFECNYTKARDKAFDILSRKPCSEKLLTEALAQRGYDELVCQRVTEELSELGYIDDEEYATLYMEQCRAKMWGEKKIRYEMKQKGISDEIIYRILSEQSHEDDIDEMAAVIIAKYGNDELDDIKMKARITRYFASRGFDFATIDAAIRAAKNMQ